MPRYKGRQAVSNHLTTDKIVCNMREVPADRRVHGTYLCLAVNCQMNDPMESKAHRGYPNCEDNVFTRLPVTISRHEAPYVNSLAAYRSLNAHFGEGHAYLLESLSGPAEDVRVAMVGFNPILSLVMHGTELAIDGEPGLVLLALEAVRGIPGLKIAGNRIDVPEDERLWSVLRAVQGAFAISGCEGLSGFSFGYFGYLGYDTVRFVEKLPHRIPNRGDMPDICLSIYQGVIKVDLATRATEMFIAHSEGFPLIDPAMILEALSRPQPDPVVLHEVPAVESVRRSIGKDDYCADVKEALHYIGIGDIYQVQLGQELALRTRISPEDVYLRLRHRNPAPYMYLASFGSTTLIGASPEIFVRIEDDEIVMRPLAGTIRRGANEAEDDAAAARLRADEKEVAEHIMLVDLCRNDIGRTCVPGSLAVNELLLTERYSHVIHLVSHVAGRLDPGQDVYDTIAACFPAGTMTGAPKIRAMEIIEELEDCRRGAYAGAVGVIDFRGNANLALCIRTAIHNGEEYVIRASAGVVADSVAEAEWRETAAKLGATYWAITGQEMLP